MGQVWYTQRAFAMCLYHMVQALFLYQVVQALCLYHPFVFCRFRVLPYQTVVCSKNQRVLIEFEFEEEEKEFQKFLIKNRFQIGQKSKLKIGFKFH